MAFPRVHATPRRSDRHEKSGTSGYREPGFGDVTPPKDAAPTLKSSGEAWKHLEALKDAADPSWERRCTRRVMGWRFAFAYDQIGIVDSQRSVSVRVVRSGAVDETACITYQTRAGRAKRDEDYTHVEGHAAGAWFQK
eukprot:Skav224320  [mRNA]  locus=scaffold227:599601:604512:+ [translate_table: standard]